MRPDDTNPQKPSIDGVRPVKRQPEYRYDHELPAPEPVDRIASTASPDPVPVNTAPQPIDSEQKPKKRASWKKKALIIASVLIIIALALVGGAYAWYQQQLAPVSNDTTQRVRVTIVTGTAPSAIAKQLQAAGVIRSGFAFTVYTQLTKTENTLKAGTYNLQPSISTPAIVDHLVKGEQDTFRLTFLPGDTLANNRQVLIKAGYTESEVDAALAKQYDRPLFAGKPAEADLEGYIFGETYEFTAAATVETILNRTFAEYEAFIEENNLISAYKAKDLTLFEGITLASIIQKEVSGTEDSRQVAQVFYKRLAEGMPLGADATFVYAAKKAGQQPTVDFKSPYNTRINQGLPPGPISAPGVNALRAVANPASGNFLYFVSGDDGVNYFSRTLAEHEAATRAHCIKNCALF